tara:strand:+ start:14654 stop:14962 length:309 start_codon:yes stop_codon:yes gene_type:complete
MSTTWEGGMPNIKIYLTNNKLNWTKKLIDRECTFCKKIYKEERKISKKEKVIVNMCDECFTEISILENRKGNIDIILKEEDSKINVFTKKIRELFGLPNFKM